MKTKKRRYSRKRRYSKRTKRRRTKRISRRRRYSRKTIRRRSKRKTRRYSRKSIKRRKKQRGGTEILLPRSSSQRKGGKISNRATAWGKEARSVASKLPHLTPKQTKGQRVVNTIQSVASKLPRPTPRKQTKGKRVVNTVQDLARKLPQKQKPNQVKRIKGAIEEEASVVAKKATAVAQKIHKSDKSDSKMQRIGKKVLPGKSKSNGDIYHRLLDSMMSKLSHYENIETAISKGLSKEMVFIMGKISGSHIKDTIELVHRMAEDIISEKQKGLSFATVFATKDSLQRYKGLNKETKDILSRNHKMLAALHWYGESKYIITYVRKMKGQMEAQLHHFSEEHFQFTSEKFQQAVLKYKVSAKDSLHMMEECLSESKLDFTKLLEKGKEEGSVVLKKMEEKLEEDDKKLEEFFLEKSKEIRKNLPQGLTLSQTFEFYKKRSEHIKEYVIKEMAELAKDVESGEESIEALVDKERENIEALVDQFLKTHKLEELWTSMRNTLHFDESIPLFCLMLATTIFYVNWYESAMDKNAVFKERVNIAPIVQLFEGMFRGGVYHLHELMYNQLKNYIRSNEDNTEIDELLEGGLTSSKLLEMSFKDLTEEQQKIVSEVGHKILIERAEVKAIEEVEDIFNIISLGAGADPVRSGSRSGSINQ